MSGSELAEWVSHSVRLSGGEERELAWGGRGVEEQTYTVPWRTFRWYKGQQHYSGSYWSSTEHDHVIYESRLELTRLLYADFDPAVRRIFAQPFMPRARVDGAVRRHVPDFLLLTDSGPVVVDVKPRHRLDAPKVAFTFGWTREVVESRGWRFEVWSEPPDEELENVRFLAGYRRDWLFDPELLAEVRALDFDGVTLGEAFESLPDRSAPLVRSAVLHLLWCRRYHLDLKRPLSREHLLAVAR